MRSELLVDLVTEAWLRAKAHDIECDLRGDNPRSNKKPLALYLLRPSANPLDWDVLVHTVGGNLMVGRVPLEPINIGCMLEEVPYARLYDTLKTALITEATIGE